jgi:phosphoesterase RecJ-like protein
MFDTKTKKHIQLEKQLYDNIIYCRNDECAIIYTTLEMENFMGKEDMEGISAIPRGIEGVEIGITIREKTNGICKVSVRTHGNYDACAFCQQFGGGGHKAAAGCAINGSVEDVIKTIIEAAESII